MRPTLIGSLLAVALVLAACPAPSSAAASPEPDRERIVILGVGDIALCNCFHDAFRTAGYGVAFDGMGGIFQRDALTIGNLECAPVDGGRPLSGKPQSIRCDVAALPVMAAAGIDVAALGNNHSADFGFDLVAPGRANVAAAGLLPAGAGADLAQANEPVLVTRGGWTIAVVSFSGVSGLGYGGRYPKTEELINPWFATTTTPGVAPASFANMEAVVAALDPVVDLVIVSLHQGEYNETRRPTELEVRRGHVLVDAGADVVIAHHHHRLLPVEYYRDRPIFWGMGNFVWKALGPDRDTTAVAEVVIDPDGTITGRLVPAYIVSHGHPVLRGLPDWSLRPERSLIR